MNHHHSFNKGGKRRDKSRTGGENKASYSYTLYFRPKSPQSAGLMWRRDLKRTFVGEQESKSKKERWNHVLCMWSIVFGRVQDQVHKFPWYSRGSALSVALEPRHSGFRQIDEAVCWNHEASSPAPDIDRRIRTICKGSGRVRLLSVYVQFKQNWEYGLYASTVFTAWSSFCIFTTKQSSHKILACCCLTLESVNPHLDLKWNIL